MKALGPYSAGPCEPEFRRRTGFAAYIGTDHPSESGRAIAYCDSSEWGAEAALEHATLFAAAPDLLEACRLFVSLLQTDYGKIGQERACNADYLAKVDRVQAGKLARAAIAKATGRTV